MSFIPLEQLRASKAESTTSYQPSVISRRSGLAAFRPGSKSKRKPVRTTSTSSRRWTGSSSIPSAKKRDARTDGNVGTHAPRHFSSWAISAPDVATTVQSRQADLWRSIMKNLGASQKRSRRWALDMPLLHR